MARSFERAAARSPGGIPAVQGSTKAGYTFILDRANGESLFPYQEVAVPQMIYSHAIDSPIVEGRANFDCTQVAAPPNLGCGWDRDHFQPSALGTIRVVAIYDFNVVALRRESQAASALFRSARP